MKAVRRLTERAAHCRCCDAKLARGTEMITFYSFRCTGAYTHLCIPCAKVIGELATANETKQLALEALKLLKAEMIASGNAGARDYGWPAASEATAKAIEALEADIKATATAPPQQNLSLAT